MSELAVLVVLALAFLLLASYGTYRINRDRYREKVAEQKDEG